MSERTILLLHLFTYLLWDVDYMCDRLIDS